MLFNNYLFTLITAAISFIAGRYSYKLKKEKYFSKSFPINYFKGIDFLLNNQEDKALKEFINAAKISSRNAEVYLALGNLFRKKGEFEKAIRIHQSILVQEDIDTEIKKTALLNLSKDFRKAGFYLRALSTLEHLESIDKKDILTIYEKIKIYILKKDWNSVLNQYKKISKNLSDIDRVNYSSVYTEIAKECIANGQFIKAKSLLKKSLKIYSQNYYTYKIFGDYYYKKNNLEKAKASYKKALNLNPFIILKIRARLNQITKDIDNIFDNKNFILTCLKIRKLIKNQDYDNAHKELFAEIINNPKINFLKNLSFIVNCLKKNNINAIKILKKELYFNFCCKHCSIVTKNFTWQCPNCKNWLSFEFEEK